MYLIIFLNANQAFFSSYLIVPMKCSTLTSCRICKTLNTPIFICSNDKLWMRYWKQSSSFHKALTNCCIRPSFTCRGGNIIFLLSTRVWCRMARSPYIEFSLSTSYASNELCCSIFTNYRYLVHIRVAGQKGNRPF